MKQVDPSPARGGLFTLPTRRPLWVMAIASLAVVASVLLVRTINSDGSLESMLPEQDSSSAALNEIAKSFELANNVTLLVQIDGQPSDPEAVLVSFAQRFEASFHDEASRAGIPCRVRWAWPGDAEAWTREVLLPNLVLYLDDAQQQALSHRLSPEGMAQQFRKNERLAATPGLAGSAMTQLLEDPLALRELVSASYAGLSDRRAGRPGQPMISADRSSLLIRIEPIQSMRSSAAAGDLVDSVQRAVQLAGPDTCNVHLGGGLAIAAAAERSIRSDMIVSSIGTVLLLQILFLLTYRKVFLFPIVFLPAAMGVLAGFAVFALSGRPLSPPTAVLGALLAGLGIDYAIHYLAHAGRGEPLQSVGRTMSRPLGIACVTSVIAFLTLIASDVSAIRDFSTIGAIGLGMTLVATLFVLPALLMQLAKQNITRSTLIATPRWRIDRVIYLTIRYRRLGQALSVLVAIGACMTLLMHPDGPVSYDSELGNMHPQPNAPLQTQQLIAEAFPGQAETLMLYITAATESELIDRAHQSTKRLRTDPLVQDHVSGTLGIDLMLPSEQQQNQRRAFVATIDPQQVQADFDRAVEDSLFTRDAFTDYRESLADLLRPGQGPALADLQRYPDLVSGLLPRHADQDDQATDLQAISLISITNPPKTRAGRRKMIETIRSSLGDVPGVTLTGFSVVGHDIETLVRRELPMLLLIAGGAIIAWLALCYRQPKDLIFALLPVMLGLLITFAIMRLTGIGLNLLNLVALPLLIGLGIDDGVLMVSIARGYRRQTCDRKRLIQSLAMSAQAVTMTTATTGLAFGSLMLTAVPAIRDLGMVMAIGIIACWAVTVGLLAPLLVRYTVLSHRDPANLEQAG